jgi:hypothetical protein
MVNPIPDFDHNLVIPPHTGDPRDLSQLSPFHCTSLDLCRKLGNTPERREILENFLDFRDRLRGEGLTQGFQWLDGSFLEDIEAREGRAPRDLDLVTIYWGYDLGFQAALFGRFPEFATPSMAKAAYSLDHYPFDAGFNPLQTVEMTRYWAQLFSHNRLGVWKGMLKIDLDTPVEDAAARAELLAVTP